MVYAQTPRDVILNACSDMYMQQSEVNSSIAMDQCNLDFDYTLKTCINSNIAFAKMDQDSAKNQCELNLEQMAKDIQSGLLTGPISGQNDAGLTGPLPPIASPTG